jgi:hypothetical protein
MLESVVVVSVISEPKRDTNTNFWFVFVLIDTNRVCVFRTCPIYSFLISSIPLCLCLCREKFGTMVGSMGSSSLCSKTQTIRL